MLLIQLLNLADVEKPLLYGLRSSSAYGKLPLKGKVFCTKKAEERASHQGIRDMWLSLACWWYFALSQTLLNVKRESWQGDCSDYLIFLFCTNPVIFFLSLWLLEIIFSFPSPSRKYIKISSPCPPLVPQQRSLSLFLHVPQLLTGF